MGVPDRLSLEDSGDNCYRIRLFAGRGDITLTRTAAIELLLDVGFVQGKTGRTAIDNHADTTAVTFAPSGDSE